MCFPSALYKFALLYYYYMYQPQWVWEQMYFSTSLGTRTKLLHNTAASSNPNGSISFVSSVVSLVSPRKAFATHTLCSLVGLGMASVIKLQSNCSVKATYSCENILKFIT